MVNNRRTNTSGQEKAQTRPSRVCLKISVLLVLAVAIAVATLPIFKIKKPLKAVYYKMAPIPALDGGMRQNDKLTKATYIGHKKVGGPETIVFSSNGTLYTGLLNGQIVRVDSEGNVHKVVQMGTQTDEKLCALPRDLSKGLQTKAECGYPLGLRIKPNTNLLYVADAYNGIFKVDLETGNKALVLGSKDSRFGQIQLSLLNDLDVDGDMIYFIYSSSERPISEGILDIIEMVPRGRLYSFNEKTGRLELLLENLYCPNGITLLPSKDAVLVNEFSTAKIIKFYVSGPKKGQKEVWADLPGFGDSLRITPHNTVFVPMATSRHANTPSLQDSLGEYPVVRSVLGTIFNLEYLFLLSPKYGMLAEYDLDGKPLKSWHDPTGKIIESVSNAVLHNNKIYLGSFYNDFIGVVDYN